MIPLLREEDYIVAADGGFPAERMNRTPDLVVADFDSGSRESAERTGSRIAYSSSGKDRTDTQEAAMVAVDRGYREFLLLGCTGGRLTIR